MYLGKHRRARYPLIVEEYVLTSDLMFSYSYSTTFSTNYLTGFGRTLGFEKIFNVNNCIFVNKKSDLTEFGLDIQFCHFFVSWFYVVQKTFQICKI